MHMKPSNDKICDKADINFKLKSIWREWEAIHSGLQEADLKKWFEDKNKERRAMRCSRPSGAPS